MYYRTTIARTRYRMSPIVPKTNLNHLHSYVYREMSVWTGIVCLLKYLFIDLHIFPMISLFLSFKLVLAYQKKGIPLKTMHKQKTVLQQRRTNDICSYFKTIFLDANSTDQIYSPFLHPFYCYNWKMIEDVHPKQHIYDLQQRWTCFILLKP